MRLVPRQRQRAQAIVVAALAMVAIVGGMAIALDAGMFFVIQRQLQSAADAGALAGAWYDPICTLPYPTCQGPAGSASTVAANMAQANGNSIAQLCGGYIAPPTIATGVSLFRPSHVNTIVVTVQCSAGYSFGRILGLDRKLITASAAAAIGDRDCVTSDMTDFTNAPPCGYIARLID
jgi:uncharacterized membrane protein